jgi:pimeloyl-ACP methyl ester carboxylesterase
MMNATKQGSPPAAVYEVVGGEEGRGVKCAVILGPVAPVWGGADFCRPLADHLAGRGYVVYVFDSIPPLEADGEPLDRYLSMIESVAGKVDLLCGYALGGTLAMVLAARMPGLGRVLNLSGPGFPEPRLRALLESVMAPLEGADVPAALRRLSELVAPEGTTPDARHTDQSESIDAQAASLRMMRGFAFLLTLDARPALAAFEGRVLSLVGSCSRLARTDNQAYALGLDPARILREIDAAGMRILHDAPQQTLLIIDEWINDE